MTANYERVDNNIEPKSFPNVPIGKESRQKFIPSCGQTLIPLGLISTRVTRGQEATHNHNGSRQRTDHCTQSEDIVGREHRRPQETQQL